jgi:fluoride ion exporter CrcB/FEX
MFTAYTLLITRLPEPNRLMAQFALYTISTFLGIFLVLIGYFIMTAMFSCRNFPPLTRETEIVNAIFLVCISCAMGIITTTMSFLWDLTYLAVVQITTWLVLYVVVYLIIVKPSYHYFRSRGR